MVNKILLTSFTTWLPHQTSNSSDDLLQEISQINYKFLSLIFLRLLPVDIELASCYVINKVKELQPNAIICCGMAESRAQLTLEAQAICGDSVLGTTVDLQQLVAEIQTIKISHDAGKFVCEGLYYSVLKYINENNLNLPCIFVHVPVLNQTNLVEIKTEFQLILDKISNL